ncbi:hypothetical protein QA601_16590 [Chitinispirillales bacterium ANBcel5]|uniref:esterase/lipase family protein n=1 Tax=Cellulosispirillum alkaliphilum TaxID=3039283 RepID=UPI002A56D9FA|nr:hypothetical protein [Chitinispirillales bacterium ANBcel5]
MPHPSKSHIATVVLSGWTDNRSLVTPLINDLKCFHKLIGEKSAGVHYFPFVYGTDGGYFETYAPIDEKSKRLFNFLNDRKLLHDHITLDIIGFSEGGMISLYALGRYKRIRTHLNKYVSIASPHGGAPYVLPFWNRNNCTAQLVGLDKDSKFLTTKYPDKAEKVFSEIPKERLLQIWSPHDLTANKFSSKRFIIDKYVRPAFSYFMFPIMVSVQEINDINRDFKDKMVSFESDQKKHNDIPQCPIVIDKIRSFLYDDLETEIKEQLSYFYDGRRIIIDTNRGFKNKPVTISRDSHDNAQYKDFENNYTVSFGDIELQSTLTQGKLIFRIPDVSPGLYHIAVEQPHPTLNTLLPSQTVSFAVMPFIEFKDSPANYSIEIDSHGTTIFSRFLPGESIAITGYFPSHHQLLINNDPVSTTLSKSDLISFKIPNDIRGLTEVKLKCENHLSNTLFFVVGDRVGNKRTKELHLRNCPWINLMNSDNKIDICSVTDKPKEKGYFDACHWCHIRHPKKIGPSNS